MERRDFLLKSGAALAGIGAAQGQEKTGPRKKEWPIVAFEKPFQALDYDRMGEELAKMGIQGIEATIRKGGHIEQKNAAEEVPKMVASLAKNGQKALLVASNVGEITPENEKFLLTLKSNGITRYRMNYYRYDLNGDMLQQVKDYTTKAKELAAFNRENGMQAIYQLHSGAKLLGGMSWDLALLLQDIDPQEIGIGYDLRHFRTDSGLSWKAALQVARKHIQAIYVKDAVWSGERSNKLKSVPLDTGFVDEATFKEVRKGQKPMPISVHMEWGKSSIYPKEIVMEAVANVAREVKTLKGWL
ncbi:sugar phosphate isomerase/epimerase [Akkermansiaceae bacterium]|nr:sugar phosphate isomerase/epimerase [Akkermansiaceae bacterium]